MISVIIPTLNAQAGLGPTLAALVTAAIDGTVRQVIVVDGGSSDRTLAIAEDAGADVVLCDERGRGQQLAAGAAKARQSWLLFLHADTVLEHGWDHEALAFMGSVDRGEQPQAAAAFRYRLEASGIMPRVIEAGVALRCSLLRLPYGDQGLLISRQFYDQIGGYRSIALMEDVDLVRRLGRRRMSILPAAALTSASRYQRDGYMMRIARNLTCLSLFHLGVAMPTLERVYYGARPGAHPGAEPAQPSTRRHRPPI